MSGHFQHREAFRLMKYVDTGGNVEWIWNSRDGVTPFGLRSRQGLESLHTDWAQDPFEPDHVPAVGDRIFVDMTEQRLREILARNVERFWDDAEYPMRGRYPSKEAAVEALYQDETSMRPIPGQPDILEVTEELHSAWLNAQEERLAARKRANDAHRAALEAELVCRMKPQTFAEFLRHRELAADPAKRAKLVTAIKGLVADQGAPSLAGADREKGGG